jgi:hypothetical protein
MHILFLSLPVIPLFETKGLRHKKKTSPLLLKDKIILHNISLKYIAEKSDSLSWNFHPIAKGSREKVATDCGSKAWQQDR